MAGNCPFDKHCRLIILGKSSQFSSFCLNIFLCTRETETNYIPVNRYSQTRRQTYRHRDKRHEYRDYHQTSNISRIFVGKKCWSLRVDGASSAGAAPTTSSFSTQHLVSMDWAKTTTRRDDKHFQNIRFNEIHYIALQLIHLVELEYMYMICVIMIIICCPIMEAFYVYTAAVVTRNKIWWLCLVPTTTTRFANDVGYKMAKKWIGLYKEIFFFEQWHLIRYSFTNFEDHFWIACLDYF